MAAFVGGAAWVFAYQWVRLDPRAVFDALGTLSPGRIAAAFLAAALGHVAITGYDAVACRAAGVRLSLPKVAAAGFIGSAFGMNAGYPLLTGTPFRVRVYALWGLPVPDVLRVVAGSAFAYWTGSLAMTGAALAFVPAGGLRLRAGLDPRWIGALLAWGWLLFFLWTLVRRRAFRFGRWTLPPPSGKRTLAALAVSALDWSLAAATLACLLPPDSNLSFAAVFGIYVPAALGVWLLQVPAGIGVLDTAVLLLLPPQAREASVLGGLLLFRGVYYLFPLAVAALLFFALEGRGHFRRRRKLLRELLARARHPGAPPEPGGHRPGDDPRG
jgi:uncharacterized membrane protein YbhN (UPF0104 family)